MVRTPPDREDEPRSLHLVGKSADSRRPDLEHVLWQQFVEATSQQTFCQAWIALQSRLLPDVRSGLVLLGTPDRGPFTPVAVWPDIKHNVKHLTPAAERALTERSGLLIRSDPTENPENPFPDNYHVAYPIEIAGKLHGVVVLEVGPRPKHELQNVLRQLHWGAGWLEVMLRRTEAMKSTTTSERLQTVLNTVASAVEHEGFHPAAIAVVTALATSLGCDRVSLGWLKRKHIRVSAVSHTADFGKQMNLVRDIGSAMDEAMDQQAVIVYPLPSEDDPLVVRAHEELVRQHGAGSICTIPLGTEGKFFGGLTFELPPDEVFDRETVELCEIVAEVIGPILNEKHKNDRWLITKAADTCGEHLKKLIGPGHLVVKLIGIAVLGLIIFFALANGDYRVTAPTTLEGVVQRAIAAPFDGYVAEAPARAGDVVQKGEVLCLLDDRDMRLERVKWATEKEQLVKQYREAMAKHERAQIIIVSAKIGQAEAQLALLDEQLARTKMVAPFNGVVTSGDLSQSLGAPVERGQVLFEMAPLDAYRLIVEVDERDITEIKVGQQGELVLPSMPGESFPFTVEKITPVSTAKEGRNYFRVEAKLDEVSERLRPGMEGVGKVSIDRRKLIWIWTHDVIDWVRLQVWRWWP
jgi:RND family efflux transporter MFP subunit